MNIKYIIENLYSIEQSNGLSDEDISFLENKYGTFPEILKEFYSLYIKSPNIYNAEDFWILPEDYRKWKWLDDKKEMILLNENQGVCYTAILEQDLKLPNPPVYITYNQGKSWNKCSETVEDFIKSALVYESVWNFEYSSETFYSITEQEHKTIQKLFSKYPFRMENWITESIHMYYDSPDSVIIIMSDDGFLQMNYGAKSCESFEKLSNILKDIGEEL